MGGLSFKPVRFGRGARQRSGSLANGPIFTAGDSVGRRMIYLGVKMRATHHNRDGYWTAIVVQSADLANPTEPR
jgi:hypothetical protein